MQLVTFSDAAIARIKQAAAEGGHTGVALRLAAQLTPDETIDYGMGFDASAEDDFQFEIDGITVLIGPASQELLHGAHLDFVELEPGQFHFIFLNPNDPNYKPPKE